MSATSATLGRHTHIWACIVPQGVPASSGYWRSNSSAALFWALANNRGQIRSCHQRGTPRRFGFVGRRGEEPQPSGEAGRSLRHRPGSRSRSSYIPIGEQHHQVSRNTYSRRLPAGGLPWSQLPNITEQEGKAYRPALAATARQKRAFRQDQHRTLDKLSTTRESDDVVFRSPQSHFVAHQVEQAFNGRSEPRPELRGALLPAASIMLPNMYASPGKYASANWGRGGGIALNGSMLSGDARSQACGAGCRSLPCMTNTRSRCRARL